MSSNAFPGRRRTALVTGATAGIGRAFTTALAAADHDLVLVARDASRLHALADELRDRHGVDVEVLPADLADRRALEGVERRVADASHPVDLLVNNAGFGSRGRFLDHGVEDEQRMLDVLVGAVLRLSHAAAGEMTRRGSGAIINVSSIAGFLPRGTYSAAKAWVTTFTVWLDLTYRPRGLRAMALCPGFVRTEFHARMGVSPRSVPGPMWLDADRVVRDALVDLENGKRISVPSRRYKVLTGLARAMPNRLLARFQHVGRGDSWRSRR